MVTYGYRCLPYIYYSCRPSVDTHRTMKGLSYAILSFFFLGVWSEECQSVIHCESQIKGIPTCDENDTAILDCFLDSCEVHNPAVQRNIEAYDLAEQVVCNNSYIKEGFPENNSECWMTAITCTWMHLVAETANATMYKEEPWKSNRQLCIYRRKTMRSCKYTHNDSSCYDIIDNFTNVLNDISACEGDPEYVADSILPLMIIFIPLVLMSVYSLYDYAVKNRK